MKSLVAFIVVVLAVGLLIAGYVLRDHLPFLPPTQTAPFPSGSASPEGNVIFPTANDQLLIGQEYELRWTGGPSPTQIFLIDTSLESQGESVSIADRVDNVNNTGSYRYTVPAKLNPGKYRFMIGDLNSDVFSIVNSPSTSPTDSQQSYCLPDDLQAGIALEPGAGNVYGTLTIKNTSQRTCQVLGNNYVSIKYDNQTVTNISVTQIGKTEKGVFSLDPGQALYTQIHYPNGPQCSGPTKTTVVGYSYAISPTASVTFTDGTGKNQQNIPTCSSGTELTTIQVWNLSAQPITQ